MTLQDKVIFAMATFLVLCGVWQQMQNCLRFICGIKYGTALSLVGKRMFSSLNAPALKPLKEDCHSKLKSMPSLSSRSCWCWSVLLVLLNCGAVSAF